MRDRFWFGVGRSKNLVDGGGSCWSGWRLKRTVVLCAVLAQSLSGLAGGTNSLLVYYSSQWPVSVVEPEKARGITNGIALKQVVEALGPGWRQPSEKVGLVSWTFRDGRELRVLLPSSRMVDGKVKQSPLFAVRVFWVTNNPGDTITNTPTARQARYLMY